MVFSGHSCAAAPMSDGEWRDPVLGDHVGAKIMDPARGGAQQTPGK